MDGCKIIFGLLELKYVISFVFQNYYDEYRLVAASKQIMLQITMDDCRVLVQKKKRL
jgi:hypothetical protein